MAVKCNQFLCKYKCKMFLSNTGFKIDDDKALYYLRSLASFKVAQDTIDILIQTWLHVHLFLVCMSIYIYIYIYNVRFWLSLFLLTGKLVDSMAFTSYCRSSSVGIQIEKRIIHSLVNLFRYQQSTSAIFLFSYINPLVIVRSTNLQICQLYCVCLASLTLLEFFLYRIWLFSNIFEGR